MKYLIRIVLIIGLFSMTQVANAADLFQTGETLTADKLNAIVPTYAIGDIGPSGGWVFYVTDDSLHGLEAAPSDGTSSNWGCVGVDIQGAELQGIGDGELNTIHISIGCPVSNNAARRAINYSHNGYFDWYLPSKDELNLMYLNIGQGSTTIGNVGGFAGFNYWSSSEVDGSNAWFQVFGNGIQFSSTKSGTYGVRAVRAF